MRGNRILFIKEVEQNPCLYDLTHPKNKDRQHSDYIWAQIGEKLGESAQNCKNKWKTIRSNYTRSLNKKARNNNNVKTKYYLTPYLDFLNPFIKTRVKKEFINPFLPITYSNNEWLNNKIQQPQNFFKQEFEPLLENKYSIPTTNQVIRDTTCEADLEGDTAKMYLLSLAPHVKTMTPREQLTFQVGVIKLIEDIKYPEPS